MTAKTPPPETPVTTPWGPTSSRVARNLARLRKARRLSTTQMSAELQAVGSPIPATGITRIEKGARRVDSDDLVALALVLNVSPLALLLPPEWSDEQVDLTLGRSVQSRTAWLWAEGRAPATDWGRSGEMDSPDDSQDEDAYWTLRREFLSLTQPPERQRAAEHVANLAVGDLSAVVNRLVQTAQAGNKDSARKQVSVAKNRLDRLRNAIEEIELELNGQDD